MKKNRKNKGFTLVELIVVLVILAILAAMLVPALTGYIDKANEKVVAAEARSAYMAAQTLVSDYYGRTSLTTFVRPAGDATRVVVPQTAVSGGIDVGLGQIEVLAEVKTGNLKRVEYDNSGKVVVVEYDNGQYGALYCATAAIATAQTSGGMTSTALKVEATFTKLAPAAGWKYVKLK